MLLFMRACESHFVLYVLMHGFYSCFHTSVKMQVTETKSSDLTGKSEFERWDLECERSFCAVGGIRE